MPVTRTHQLAPCVAAALIGWTVASPATAATPAEVAEAVIVSKQAKSYFDAGQFALAAELYRRAFQIDSSRSEYLYGVGRAQHRAGQLADAAAAYGLVLTIMPASHPLRPKVQAALAEVKATPDVPPPPQATAVSPVVGPAPSPAPLPQPVTAATEPVPAVPAPPIAPAAPMAGLPAIHTPAARGVPISTWTLLVGGAATAAVGAGLGIWAGLEDSALQDDLGRVSGDAAAERQGTINTLSSAAVASAAVGVVAVGIGWWRLGPKRSVHVAPRGDGLKLAIRF